MEWNEIAVNPLLLENYNLLQKMGILDYIEQIKVQNRELEDHIKEAYDLFTKKTLDDLINYLIDRISARFIPSTLVIILNDDIQTNKLRTIAFRNLHKVNHDEVIKNIDPYRDFFDKYSGTTHMDIMEAELGLELSKPFRDAEAEIIIPVHGHSGLYGLILIGSKILGELYSNHEIEYIDRLMRFIGVGIQNNIHYEHSVKDGKTGLYNHNFFMNRLTEEISRSQRVKRAFSIIIMDIDHFKHFNDTYGHLVGDEVIIQIAELLKVTLRDMDIISRFGGEEFTVLLPETNNREAANAAERIRKAIEALEIPHNGEFLKVTLSLGVSSFNYHETCNVDELINRADEALYKSKEGGRNRVTVHKPGLLHKAKSFT